VERARLGAVAGARRGRVEQIWPSRLAARWSGGWELGGKRSGVGGRGAGWVVLGAGWGGVGGELGELAELLQRVELLV
jgi:hypothetical protein